MTSTSRWWLPLGLGSALAIGLLIASPSFEASAQSPSADDATLERGRYIAHDVAMCVQCHSPRTSDGSIVQDKIMRGGPVAVDGPPWIEQWAYLAPDLLALSRGRADYVIEVLTTGKRPDGSVPKAPMPPIRLSDEDARAVVAYLNSLR